MGFLAEAERLFLGRKLRGPGAGEPDRLIPARRRRRRRRKGQSSSDRVRAQVRFAVGVGGVVAEARVAPVVDGHDVANHLIHGILKSSTTS